MKYFCENRYTLLEQIKTVFQLPRALVVLFVMDMYITSSPPPSPYIEIEVVVNVLKEVDVELKGKIKTVLRSMCEPVLPWLKRPSIRSILHKDNSVILISLCEIREKKIIEKFYDPKPYQVLQFWHLSVDTAPPRKIMEKVIDNATNQKLTRKEDYLIRTMTVPVAVIIGDYAKIIPQALQNFERFRVDLYSGSSKPIGLEQRKKLDFEVNKLVDDCKGYVSFAMSFEGRAPMIFCRESYIVTGLMKLFYDLCEVYN